MKLTAAQLGPHLSKTLSPVYLVFGNEPFLVQETLNLIREKAFAAGFTERLRLDLEADSDLNTLYSHAYTPSLLDEKRLIELRWKGDKLSKAGQQFMQAYAQKPGSRSLLVSELGKLDSKTEQTQWFKTLEKNTVVVSIWPLSQNQVPAWLQDRARRHHFELSRDAANELAYLTEGNLAAAAMEIEKLSLLGLPLVDSKALAPFIEDQGCFTAFDLVDQSLSAHGPEILRILKHLQNEGAEPLMILGAFTFELRTLAKLSKELDRGLSLSTLFSQYRIRLGKQAGIRAFFKRGMQGYLWDLFQKAGEIDRLAKGAISGDIWLALEQFSLALAGIVPQKVPQSFSNVADPSRTIYN